ncbi:hypothetical protein [Paraburkholderia sp. J67]|uniref:hypothetical protein n=1 Tax=Paraburkholderia sp. J67 TaxID=2805435 RepID=UPI002ABD4FF0|nr:hypothetical protein [Paraburkholderia sp. J67]
MNINRHACAATAIFLGSVIASLPAWSQQCRLVEMKVSGQTAQAANVSVDLGEASPPDSSSPMAYQGPPKIRVGDGASCTASDDVSIIFGRQWLAGNRIYFSTYSGSENRVYAIDTRDCHTLWHSRVFEGGPAKYRNGVLIMGNQRVRLDRSCSPK